MPGQGICHLVAGSGIKKWHHCVPWLSCRSLFMVRGLPLFLLCCHCCAACTRGTYCMTVLCWHFFFTCSTPGGTILLREVATSAGILSQASCWVGVQLACHLVCHMHVSGGVLAANLCGPASPVLKICMHACHSARNCTARLHLLHLLMPQCMVRSQFDIIYVVAHATA